MGHMGSFHAQVQAAICNLFTVYKAGVFRGGEGYSCSETEGYVQSLKPVPIRTARLFALNALSPFLAINSLHRVHIVE
jgi:hypothetical protein